MKSNGNQIKKTHLSSPSFTSCLIGLNSSSLDISNFHDSLKR